MQFFDAVRTCLRNYATFRGRAGRPEFWWFMLFATLASMVAAVFGERINLVVTVLLLLPAIAVTARRLHDIDRSGWWQLVGMVPLVGWIVVLYWYVQPSQPGPNRFG
ncbi:DUF805 domain-containing protein [Ramlibacter sp. AN1015]|uniref:DUF805 domain-containing protein n=1 Tax=Ramlibacter sp. AN1015 TaxID=3133428 RepID=UPI0030C426E6